ncbi:MAG: dolichol kinase [Euryarchaeota archaeon]|nr:dolichol kinase [Euryarchaeota archaeon]MBU4491557.1 dolichol kinase [Euryarchaeota archaeon]
MELLSHELLRKTFHVLGIYIPIAYYFLSKERAVMLLSLINAVLLLVEWLRLSGKIKLPEVLLRPHEKKNVAAYIYFQMGALFSILIFDKTIAIAALLMLALGDAASGLAGAMIKGGDVRYNDAKNTVKPVPIMAVMFSVCILIGLFLLDMPLAPDMTYLSFYVYAAGALGATLGDAIPIRIMGKPIDDNLMIPLLAGAFMTAAGLLVFELLI